jgi:hypothetical protein
VKTTCLLCGRRAGTVSHLLRHPWCGTDFEIQLCRPCAVQLSWRADDPVLIAPDGSPFAGKAVRAAWHRVQEWRARTQPPEAPTPGPPSDEEEAQCI